MKEFGVTVDRLATNLEVEQAFYQSNYCSSCRNWRIDPDAKTQCPISGSASAGVNDGHWKVNEDGVYCTQFKDRGLKVKRKQKRNAGQDELRF